MLAIRIKDINVIDNDNHLGIDNNSVNLPVMVHSAIAITIEAKSKINISLKFHKITVDIISAAIDRNEVDFKLNISSIGEDVI